MFAIILIITMKTMPKLIPTFILNYDHIFLDLEILMYYMNIKSLKLSALLAKKISSII